MRCFFDSNVLVYAFGRDEGRKRFLALDLINSHVRERSFVISTQVLMETWDVLVRKHRRQPADVLATLRLLASQDVVAPAPASALLAMERAQRDRLSNWDALIVQAALDGGCDCLYSEDFQAGRRFGALEVVNPFDSAAHEPVPKYEVAAKAAPRRAAKQSAKGVAAATAKAATKPARRTPR